jgi:hypothetical protein
LTVDKNICYNIFISKIEKGTSMTMEDIILNGEYSSNFISDFDLFYIDEDDEYHWINKVGNCYELYADAPVVEFDASGKMIVIE